MAGSIRWLAPELLKAGLKPKYTVQSDVFSLGIVLWEIAHGKAPYADVLSNDMVVHAVSQGEREEISDETPVEYAQLIRECWDDNPANRPTAQDVATRLERMLEVDANLGQSPIPTVRIRPVEAPAVSAAMAGGGRAAPQQQAAGSVAKGPSSIYDHLASKPRPMALDSLYDSNRSVQQ